MYFVWLVLSKPIVLLRPLENVGGVANYPHMLVELRFKVSRCKVLHG